MKRVLCLMMLFVSIISITSCNFKSSDTGSGNSIIGTWQEYRDDGDDYLLSTYIFHSDGSGVFKVQALSNTQRLPFTWTLSGQKKYIEYDSGETTALSYNQGLIIEHSGFGEVVFKKK